MSLRSLLLLLLAFAAPLAGCPSGDDDDSADDDDATGDDDDDDDATGDDDDSTPPGPIVCDGGLPVLDEGEPNDAIDGALDPGAPTAGFCVEGTLTCGDEEYGDLDHTLLGLPVDREVRVALRWSGESDADKYVYARDAFDPEPTKEDEVLLSWEEGTSGLEEGTVALVGDAEYVVRIGCWSGQDTPYTLTVTWDDLPVGDDDDSAGDDDDSAGDDDDSAGDDDDSASCVSEMLGNAIDDDCDGEVDEYTFTQVYTLMLSPSCSCHSGSSHSTGWFFSSSASVAYGNLVNVASTELPSMDRVEPNASSTSYLVHKIDGTHLGVGGSGSRMPLGGSMLPASVRDGVRGWIDSGAPND